MALRVVFTGEKSGSQTYPFLFFPNQLPHFVETVVHEKKKCKCPTMNASLNTSEVWVRVWVSHFLSVCMVLSTIVHLFNKAKVSRPYPALFSKCNVIQDRIHQKYILNTCLQLINTGICGKSV